VPACDVTWKNKMKGRKSAEGSRYFGITSHGRSGNRSKHDRTNRAEEGWSNQCFSSQPPLVLGMLRGIARRSLNVLRTFRGSVANRTEPPLSQKSRDFGRRLNRQFRINDRRERAGKPTMCRSPPSLRELAFASRFRFSA